MKLREQVTGRYGFTLVELMITMVISSLIVAAIYSAYLTQNRVYNAQQSVAEMQQNLRAGLGLMIRDIRMAGYDKFNSASAGFVDNVNFSNGGALNETVFSSATQIAFTADLDSDGTIDQATEDINGDGNTDMTEMEQFSYRLNVTGDLQRYSTTTGAIEWYAVAEHIDSIEFNYLDSDGNITTDLNNISEVQVSILARARQPDRKFTNNMIYTPASGVANNWGPYNDNFRRRLLITTINCRNMGL